MIGLNDRCLVGAIVGREETVVLMIALLHLIRLFGEHEELVYHHEVAAYPSTA